MCKRSLVYSKAKGRKFREENRVNYLNYVTLILIVNIAEKGGHDLYNRVKQTMFRLGGDDSSFAFSLVS